MSFRYLLLVTTTALMLSGCFGHKARIELPTAPPPPCSAHLDKIQAATYAEGADDAIRGWLQCLGNANQVGAYDLQAEVERILNASPFPAIQRERADIIDHFFNRELMKALPESYGSMVGYQRLLEDQALVATAQGDLKLAEAISARSRKIQLLGGIIEDVQ